MTENKTQARDDDVRAFLQSVEHPVRRADGLALLEMFEAVTGFEARMWGPTIVGFGRYHYRYDSGREGESLATGFSSRAGNLSIYIMPGYQDYSAILEKLGRHKLGKSCLYVNKLADIDLDVLKELVQAGLRDLDAMWPVQPK